MWISSVARTITPWILTGTLSVPIPEGAQSVSLSQNDLLLFLRDDGAYVSNLVGMRYRRGETFAKVGRETNVEVSVADPKLELLLITDDSHVGPGMINGFQDSHRVLDFGCLFSHIIFFRSASLATRARCCDLLSSLFCMC